MKSTDFAQALNIGRATHEGMSGKHNEDYYGFFAWEMDDGRPFYLGIVADGIGGQNAGEVASRLAVKAVERYFEALGTVNSVPAHLERAILAANEAVHAYAQQNQQYEGMGTTMVVAAVVDDRLYTSNVGDSRIYFWRDGRLRQISVDHTWAQEAIEAGLLTKEQARTHPNRNVIKRFLGTGSQVEVDQRLQWEAGQDARTARGNQGLVLEPGDLILLCSDGLTDMIRDRAVRDSIHSHYNDLERAAEELIDKANQGGGKDNITAVIMQVPGGRAPAAGRAAAPAVAATTGEATASATAVAAPEAESPARRGASFLLLGGLGLLGLVFVLGLGALFVFSRRNDGNPSPTAAPTSLPALVETSDRKAFTDEPPATAGLILATAGSGTVTAPAGTPDGTVVNTPALIPTLRPTATPTRTRIPPTPTRTPTTEPTATTPSGGGDGQPPPPPPPATATREPGPPTSTPPSTDG